MDLFRLIKLVTPTSVPFLRSLCAALVQHFLLFSLQQSWSALVFFFFFTGFKFVDFFFEWHFHAELLGDWARDQVGQ